MEELEPPVFDVDDERSLKRARRRVPKRFQPNEIGRERNTRVKRSKDADDDDDNGPPIRRSLRLQSVEIKVENAIEGKIKCPLCGWGALVGTKGCNVFSCVNHTPRFYYFCLHCKEECPDEIARCSCPKRNDIEARLEAQRMRNRRAAENPIILLSDDEEGTASTSDGERKLPAKAKRSEDPNTNNSNYGDESITSLEDMGAELDKPARNDSYNNEVASLSATGNEKDKNTHPSSSKSQLHPEEDDSVTKAVIGTSSSPDGVGFASENEDEHDAGANDNIASMNNPMATTAQDRPTRTAAPTTFNFDSKEEDEEEEEEESDEEYQEPTMMKRSATGMPMWSVIGLNGNRIQIGFPELVARR